MKILSGRSNPKLASLISKQLDTPLTPCSLSNFSDGETSVSIEKTVRGEDCFVIQSTCAPVNDNLMELIFMIDALKRADAKSITAVIPYFGYSRQDRRAKPRQPISAKTVANMITAAGANRIVSMDLHAGQLEGFFDIPTVHLMSKPLFLEVMLNEYGSKDIVFISPDAGSMNRVASLVKGLDYPVGMIDKRRSGPNKIKSVRYVGEEISGKTAIIFDDILDTGGTLLKSAELLKEKGAQEIVAFITHGIFSGEARARLLGDDSPFTRIYVSNTIPVLETHPKLIEIDVSFLFTKTLKRIQTNGSVSSMFN